MLLNTQETPWKKASIHKHYIMIWKPKHQATIGLNNISVYIYQQLTQNIIQKASYYTAAEMEIISMNIKVTSKISEVFKWKFQFEWIRQLN